MYDGVDIADRDEAMLVELAELDLAAARRVHERLMAAEDAAEVADLGRTYQRLARSLRQTLALKARLKRERERARDEQDDWDAPPGLSRELEDAIHTRKIAVRAAVTRAIWTEAEGPEVERLLEHLEGDLDLGAISDTFVREPLDAHIARLCERMRHRLAAARSDDRQDPDRPTADGALWRSSA